MKALRELLGMTQEQFAAFLGVTTRTVHRWENGQSEPSFKISQYRRLESQLKLAGYDLRILPDSLLPGNHLHLGGQQN